jgi:hypothetical protein
MTALVLFPRTQALLAKQQNATFLAKMEGACLSMLPAASLWSERGGERVFVTWN